jgi:hypothetical protein
MSGTGDNASNQSGLNPATSSAAARQQIKNVFVFQFWPQQVQDNYTPNYATKNIPGASHPLYQWVSGSGRDISFTANFVSEVYEDELLEEDKQDDFRARINKSSATSTQAGRATAGARNAVGALLLPSTRYKVNVAAALATLQQYLYPDYSSGDTRPPRKLVLVLPGTKLGRTNTEDGILCIMRSAAVTMESWFPSGELRAASVALRFSEIIQHSTASGVSKIKYIGAEKYADLAERYQITVNNPNEMSLG